MHHELPNIAAGFSGCGKLSTKDIGCFLRLLIDYSPSSTTWLSSRLKGDLLQTVRRIIYAVTNTQGVLITLVLNGYGHDAMKLARSIYEAELNIVWLMKHPEDIDDFIDYNVIQQKQEYELLDDEQQRCVLKSVTST